MLSQEIIFGARSWREGFKKELAIKNEASKGALKRDLSKEDDTLSVQPIKKCKIEEQQDSPSKHQFRAQQGNSKGEYFLFDANSNEYGSSIRSSCITQQFGVHLVESERESTVYGSKFWKENIRDIDGKTAGKLKASETAEIETARHLSSASSRSSRKVFLHSISPAANEIVWNCMTGHPCISELSEHEYLESNQYDRPSGSSTTFDRNVRKKKSTGYMEFLDRSFQDRFIKDDKLYIQGPAVDNNQCTRLFSWKSIEQTKESDGESLLETDETKTDSVVSSISALMSHKENKQKSISTKSCFWELGSESAFDKHTCCSEEKGKSIEHDGICSSNKRDSCPNTLVCNVGSPSAMDRSLDTSTKYSETIENIMMNEETHSPTHSLSIDNVEALPLYVLSSGRKKRMEETQLSNNRAPTIDQDFEQFFSELML